ncbi:hypothetical protein N8I74_16535 [Chitiniphilus purpureus]|uniref:Pyrroloquinoline quinone-dependent pyranose dehydrogenase beta-propeller domain-containing protein n=1 Tax=Chitiniphilus purpureus TaxID=2981137 RepID=A0ABY6DN26_9NEIS|nr:hypothetical protein [Chitiniphilus sp. CD1]UXY14906.1 hypothetical protein N8I74_16535 [Chitiniphilus sp. CD1]
MRLRSSINVAGLSAGVFVSLALLACSSAFDDDGNPGGGAPTPVVTPTPTAPGTQRVAVTLEVPAGLGAAPLDTPRTLTVPAGFGVRVVARIPDARFMAEAANGDLLVSQPSTGVIKRVVRNNAASVVNDFATGLNGGHDLVFHQIGTTQYLYIGERNRISRAPYVNGDVMLRPRTAVVANLPDASLAELNGQYGHQLKNIAFVGETLLVSIASATNAAPSDILANPKRGAVYAFDANGGGMRLFAQGLRNAEGLAVHPVTGALWAVVNHRDNVRYPLQDGRYPYKGLDQAYVNDNPPEPFTQVRDGGNYGWPYCNPDAAQTTDLPPYLPDVENNENQAALDCGTLDRISKALPAHSAPLGLSFWTGESAPAGWRNGALIGLHGCWNCSAPRGYKVIHLPLNSDNSFGDAQDLVTGFLSDPDNIASRWGRPVDVIPNRDGNLYISDDHAGAIYELYRK